MNKKTPDKKSDAYLKYLPKLYQKVLARTIGGMKKWRSYTCLP